MTNRLSVRSGRTFQRRFRKPRGSISVCCAVDLGFVSAAAAVLHWLEAIPNLRELQVDFVGCSRGYWYRWEELPESLEHLFNCAQTASAKLKAAPGNADFQKLVLTGLPDNDLALNVVRTMASLMGPGGEIGVARGIDGHRYTKCIDPSHHSDYDSEDAEMDAHLRQPRRLDLDVHYDDEETEFVHVHEPALT